MKNIKLSIIMPTYNPENLDLNIKEALRSLDSLKIKYELIVVNDGSKKIIKNNFVGNSKVKIEGYKENQGKGNAIKYGFQFTKGEYVAFVDSGRDINPTQLGNFIKILEKEKADIVIGSKRHKLSNVHYPLTRRLMSKVYQVLNHLLFNLKVQDTQVGIKLFKRKVLEKIMPKIAIKRFAFDLELLVLATKMNAKIIEAPVTIRYKFGSTVNVKAVFWILWDTAAIFYRDKILRYYG